MAKKALTYNEVIAEIEDILVQMENEEMDVDELSAKVKKVSELLKTCRKKLTQTEEEVEKILSEMSE